MLCPSPNQQRQERWQKLQVPTAAKKELKSRIISAGLPASLAKLKNGWCYCDDGSVYVVTNDSLPL